MRGLEQHVTKLESDVQHLVSIAQEGRKEVKEYENRVRLGLPIYDIWGASLFNNYQGAIETHCYFAKEDAEVRNQYYED
jgi:hypothetical protein